MKTITLEEAKQKFDALFVSENAFPFEIINNGKSLGVFLPYADVELIDDILLGYKAMQAHKEGYLNETASCTLLDRYLHMQD